MRTSTLNGITAGLGLTIALFNGATAMGENNEVAQAETNAEVYEQRGQHEQADAWEDYADEVRTDRNIHAGLSVVWLGIASMNGALAVMIRKNEENLDEIRQDISELLDN